MSVVPPVQKVYQHPRQWTIQSSQVALGGPKQHQGAARDRNTKITRTRSTDWTKPMHGDGAWFATLASGEGGPHRPWGRATTTPTKSSSVKATCIGRRNRYHVRPIEADSTKRLQLSLRMLESNSFPSSTTNLQDGCNGILGASHTPPPVCYHLSYSGQSRSGIFWPFMLRVDDTLHAQMAIVPTHRLGPLRVRSRFLNTIVSRHRTFT